MFPSYKNCRLTSEALGVLTPLDEAVQNEQNHKARAYLASLDHMFFDDMSLDEFQVYSGLVTGG